MRMSLNERKIIALFSNAAPDNDSAPQQPAPKGSGLTPAEINEMWDMAMDHECKGG